MSMIQLTEVSKSFNDKVIFHNLSFSIARNNIVAIVGPSGCGKTTLSRIICGLDEPDLGAVFVDDMRISYHNREKIYRKIAYVFQDFQLFENMSVVQNVAYSKGGKNPSSETIELAIDTLKRVSMDSYSHERVGSLSGGQKQRVAIARALISGAKIIIMDEPTASLDQDSINSLSAILQSLKQEITVAVVTHNLNFAKSVCDYAISLNESSAELIKTEDL